MFEIQPVENPDWDYARNKLVILKSPLAEFSMSALTAPVNIGEFTFYGGNRDYSWQGLLGGPFNGELYKIFDSVYFSVPETSLRALDIVLDGLNSCTCRYFSGRGEKVSFRLTVKSATHEILFEALVNRPCWYTIMLDSRPAESWAESIYRIKPRDGMLEIAPSTIPYRLIVEGFSRIEQTNLKIKWRYKLGDGFRRIDSGIVRFIEHQRLLHIPVMLFAPKGYLRIKIPHFIDVPETESCTPEAVGTNIRGSSIADAIDLRLRTLSSYSILSDGIWFPEAGSWWFRKPWIRDSLEGIRWNMKTYFQILKWDHKVISLVNYLFAMFKSLGGLPITVGSKEFASDAPPQLLNIACKTAEMLTSSEMLLETLETAQFISARLLKGGQISNTVIRDSILCSPANSSWIDSVVACEGKSWPTRLPRSWAEHEVDPFSSNYALLEVNALYIEALTKLKAACEHFKVETRGSLDELLSILSEGFARYFMKQSVPPITVVPTLGLVDHTLGSPLVIALSVLKEMYDEELTRIWRVVSDNLLVYRRLMLLGKERYPFGILVRAVEKAPYLGDEEYHGSTIWPRDTPYLLRLMEKVGEDVNGLLVNNLDHMLVEGAVGYCNELFSLPVGGNSFNSLESDNPVPVKNPAQYWSHWCDPYLEHMPELLAKQMG
jgi:hypothetical protein